MNNLAREFILSILKERNCSEGQVMYEMLSTEGSIYTTPERQNRIKSYLKENGFDSQESTIENYIQANIKRQKAQKIYGSLPSIILFSEKESESIFSDADKDWDLFKKKYPKSEGIWDFSAPGFSNDEQEAIFYMGWRAGDLMGVGNYYFHKLQNGSWEEEASIITWIS